MLTFVIVLVAIGALMVIGAIVSMVIMSDYDKDDEDLED